MSLLEKTTPKLFKLLLSIYPPYLGAGIKITHVSEDWRELHAVMSMHWFNKNALGTHFGGSLYSMVDPHLVLLLIRLLGKDFWVWDKSAEIEFVKASKKKVTAIIKITDEDLKKIKRNTNGGEKYYHGFIIEVKDESNDIAAIIRKTVYV